MEVLFTTEELLRVFSCIILLNYSALRQPSCSNRAVPSNMLVLFTGTWHSDRELG